MVVYVYCLQCLHLAVVCQKSQYGRTVFRFQSWLRVPNFRSSWKFDISVVFWFCKIVRLNSSFQSIPSFQLLVKTL